MLTLGLFVDGGGTDAYRRLPGVTPPGAPVSEITAIDSLAVLDFTSDGKIWSRATERNRVPGAYGVGIDAK